jgi:hypothetical protein
MDIFQKNNECARDWIYDLLLRRQAPYALDHTSLCLFIFLNI